jgi:alkylation response protein AidB-like acyl-CoA dehydrogenase
VRSKFQSKAAALLLGQLCMQCFGANGLLVAYQTEHLNREDEQHPSFLFYF